MRRSARRRIGPGQLEGRRESRLAGHDELARELDLRLHLAQHRVHPVDHRRRHARGAVAALVAGAGVGGQLRPDHEQLALDAEDLLIEPGECRAGLRRRRQRPQLRPGQAERRDGLVHGAIGLGPQVVLRHALAAVEERGGAVVATPGRDGGVVVEGVVGHRAGVADGTAITTSGRRRADPSARPAG